MTLISISSILLLTLGVRKFGMDPASDIREKSVFEHIKRQESLAHLFGLRAESVSKEEAKERWPLMNNEDVMGAVWSPDDGRVSPSDLCAALIKGAKAKGTKIFEDTVVKAILTKGKKVVGVETTLGNISCDAIALCAGFW